MRRTLERKSRKSQRRRPGRSRGKNLVWAAVFFVLGVIGVLIPVVPQIPFFIMSLLFLSLVFPGIRRWLRRFLHRHPKIGHAYKKWKDRRRRKRQRKIRSEKAEKEVAGAGAGARSKEREAGSLGPVA